MKSAFRFLVLRYFLDSYPGIWAVPMETIGALLTLLVYKFTSEAFGHAFGGDYFQFVVAGEIAIATPILIFGAVTRAVQQSIAEGTFDYLRLSARGPAQAFAVSA